MIAADLYTSFSNLKLAVYLCIISMRVIKYLFFLSSFICLLDATDHQIKMCVEKFLYKWKKDMKLNNEIHPGIGIGGINLGENIDTILSNYAGEHDIEQISESSYSFDDGYLTLYTDDVGTINHIACNKKFPGVFAGMLWPGMTVSDVLENSHSRVAWFGFVKVNAIKGIGLSLPNEFDDFDEITDHLDLDFVFEELWVCKYMNF
jgi:hypothetical protein